MKLKKNKIKRDRWLNKKFWLTAAGKYILLDFMVSFLFYNSYVLFISLLPLFAVYIRFEKKAYMKQLLRARKLEFREAMTAMYGMIASGYSLESAIKGVPDELALCYGKDSWVIGAFDKMAEALNMNVPAQRCLEAFAKDSNDEDIMSFYEIICIAKKYGGSMTVVIKMAIDRISRRIETECEIMTLIAGRKNEFTVMTLIPACIILYMRLSSAELMAVLYTQTAGRIVMTLCLIVYAAAAVWGKVMTRKAMAAV